MSAGRVVWKDFFLWYWGLNLEPHAMLGTGSTDYFPGPICSILNNFLSQEKQNVDFLWNKNVCQQLYKVVLKTLSFFIWCLYSSFLFFFLFENCI